MSGAAPESLKSLSRADSSHACRHSLLADDDLNPFVSSRTAWTRHPWIGAYSDFHLFDGWRHAIPRLSELSLCLTTYPNSGFFRWHRSQTRLRVRTLRSQLLLVDFIEKPFDRLLHASTVSTPSRIWFIPIVVKEHKDVVATFITYSTFHKKMIVVRKATSLQPHYYTIIFKLVLGEGFEPPSRPYQSLIGYKPTALTIVLSE